jgi:RimJ/RimL family protein N-acetyltransferase
VAELSEPIETERLTLRRFRNSDLDALHAIQSSPEVARYLYWEPRTRDQVAVALAERLRPAPLAADDDVVALAVERREDGRLLGDLTLWLRSAEHRQAEIGFVFDPAVGGRGYATEAARALVGFAFDSLGAHRVYGRTDVRNLPSARLMERLGMRREAHFREAELFKGEWSEELVFAVLEREWKP